VSDFTMVATPPLDGYAKDFDGVSLAEITNRAIISIATPAGGEAHLAKAVKSAFGTTLPNIGGSQSSTFSNGQFLGLQQGQTFFVFEHDAPNALEIVAEQLKDVAYLSDQTDSFVMLTISGKNARLALERICLIDLHPDAFSIGRVARTSMEHLSVIIQRTAEDAFLLMSPRSSAQSFLHVLETSIYNVT